MDLVTPSVHLTLTYLEMLNRSGVEASDALLDAYGDAPKRLERVTARGFAALLARAEAEASAFSTVTSPGETMSGYLRRLAWVSGSASDARISAVGRAVLNHANRPVADDEHASVSVVIDPEDPLAYLRIFDLINSHEGGLLIDPYLKLAGLSDLLEISTVTRVLTSTDKRTSGVFARAIAATEAELEARTIAQTRLHDRFFITDDAVYVLGSSLNSITKRPGVVTPITDPVAVAAISSTYETLWSEATPLKAPAESEEA